MCVGGGGTGLSYLGHLCGMEWGLGAVYGTESGRGKVVGTPEGEGNEGMRINVTSLFSGDLVLLELKHRAVPHLELWGRLIDMCLVDCYDEMVRDLCGVSCEFLLTTGDTSYSTSTSEETSKSECDVKSCYTRHCI